MSGLRQARLLCAIVLAPVIAFAVGASSTLALRCSLTGRLIAEPCCPEAAREAAGNPPAHASIVGADCCERVVVSSEKLPAIAGERALEAGASPPVAAVPAPLAAMPPAPSRRAPAWRARPPGTAAPAFLLSHAFLI